MKVGGFVHLFVLYLMVYVICRETGGSLFYFIFLDRFSICIFLKNAQNFKFRLRFAIPKTHCRPGTINHSNIINTQNIEFRDDDFHGTKKKKKKCTECNFFHIFGFFFFFRVDEEIRRPFALFFQKRPPIV